MLSAGILHVQCALNIERNKSGRCLKSHLLEVLSSEWLKALCSWCAILSYRLQNLEAAARSYLLYNSETASSIRSRYSRWISPRYIIYVLCTDEREEVPKRETSSRRPGETCNLVVFQFQLLCFWMRNRCLLQDVGRRGGLGPESHVEDEIAFPTFRPRAAARTFMKLASVLRNFPRRQLTPFPDLCTGIDAGWQFSMIKTATHVVVQSFMYIVCDVNWRALVFPWFMWNHSCATTGGAKLSQYRLVMPILPRHWETILHRFCDCAKGVCTWWWCSSLLQALEKKPSTLANPLTFGWQQFLFSKPLPEQFGKFNLIWTLLWGVTHGNFGLNKTQWYFNVKEWSLKQTTSRIRQYLHDYGCIEWNQLSTKDNEAPAEFNF